MSAETRKDKPTYPALFTAGFTYIEDKDIEQVFVGLLGSPRRKMLVSMLKLFIHKLRSLGVKGELWIDGSFSTQNPEPMDVDLLLVIPRVVLSAMTNESREELAEITENRTFTRKRWSCDLYAIESSNFIKRRYFEELFSKNPDKENRKGIPVVRL